MQEKLEEIHIIEFIKKLEYLLASVAYVLRSKCAKYYSPIWWYTVLSFALRETLQRFTFLMWLMTMHVVSTRDMCIRVPSRLESMVLKKKNSNIIMLK